MVLATLCHFLPIWLLVMNGCHVAVGVAERLHRADGIWQTNCNISISFSVLAADHSEDNVERITILGGLVESKCITPITQPITQLTTSIIHSCRTAWLWAGWVFPWWQWWTTLSSATAWVPHLLGNTYSITFLLEYNHACQCHPRYYWRLVIIMWDNVESLLMSPHVISSVFKIL